MDEFGLWRVASKGRTSTGRMLGRMNGDYRNVRITLVICAILTQMIVAAVYINVLGLGGPPSYGHAGANIEKYYSPYHSLVTSVEPGGPAERAGLRKGDVVDERANSAVERWQWFYGFLTPLYDTPTTLSVERAGKTVSVTVTPDRWDLRRFWIIWVGPLGDAFVALIGAMIAWRAKATKRNVLLAATLVLLSIGDVLADQNFAFHTAGLYVATTLLGTLVQAATIAWVFYAATFLARRSRMFAALAGGVVLLQVYVVLMNIPETIALTTLWLPPGSPYFKLLLPQTVSAVLGIGCSIIAIASTDSRDRARALWSLCPLALFFAARVALNYLPAVASGYTMYLVEISLFNLNAFLFPALLAYVALTRRFIDIGFVLNRAAVFTLLSTIVVGGFVLFEYTIGSWLSEATHTTSAVAGALIALALGLSLKFIHHHVDRFVDRVFFRRRHDDERALRAFAFETSFMTDRTLLLERTVIVVERHSGTRSAGVLFPRSDVSENDPAILALRAWGKPLDLHSIPGTAITGDHAFPMLAHGSLVAVLVCAEKANEESFAPDEIDALQLLAHSVGVALDNLSAPARDGLQALRNEIAEMRGAIVAELRSLRAASKSQ